MPVRAAKDYTLKMPLSTMVKRRMPATTFFTTGRGNLHPRDQAARGSFSGPSLEKVRRKDRSDRSDPASRGE